MRSWRPCHSRAVLAMVLLALVGCTGMGSGREHVEAAASQAAHGGDQTALGTDVSVSGGFQCQWGADCTLKEVLQRAHVCALLVVQRGRPVFEYYEQANANCSDKWQPEPNGPGKTYGLASVAKSMTSTLLGAIWSQSQRFGRIELDDTVSQHVPNLHARGHLREVTIRQALTMSSALKFNEYDNDLEARTSDQKDPTKTFAQAASRYTQRDWGLLPGATFRYAGLDTTLVGLVVEAMLKRNPDGPQHMDDALARWFLPSGNGLEPGRWKQDTAGMPNPFCCFYLTTHQLAALGQRVLDGWKGRPVDGSVNMHDWLVAATTTQIWPRYRDCRIANRRVRLGYGYQWWTLSGADGFTAKGTGGQFLHILPQQEAVIVQFGSWPNDTWPEDTECSVYAAHRFLADRTWD